MIATSRFLFVHLHKSGGTFVNNWLARFFRDAQPIGYHLPYKLAPPALAHLPVLGTVRSPWSYYVSWYAFQSGLPRPNPLFQTMSEGGRLDFEGTIRNMLSLCEGGALLDAAVAALPAGFTKRGINLPGPELAAIAGTGLGFYGFLYRYMYAGAENLHVVRMEEMRGRLAETVREFGASVSAEAESFLAIAPAANTTVHASAAEYYGSALSDLVADRDRSVIERHGYEFGV